MNNRFDVIVVGAGASGLIAAGTAARRGKSVLLLEKKQKGARKVLITGKGRCNVTNCCDMDDFLVNVKHNPRFLYSAISNFSPYDTMGFFEDLGVPLKVERGERVFPVSDKAMDIVDALVEFGGHHKNTKFVCNARVSAIIQEDGAVKGVKLESGEKYYADSILISTGGKSYPLTGTTGDGYTLAKQVGHQIVPTSPGLVPIETLGGFCPELMGISLKNVTLTVKDNETGKVIYSQLGEMLFTHFGITGPLVLSASVNMQDKDVSCYTIYLDMKPALDTKKLDNRFLREFDAAQNKDITNVMNTLMPRKMGTPFLRLCGINPNAKVNQITKEERLRMVNTLKSIEIQPMRFRPIEEAIVTVGGVQTKEINPKTMESKICKGLYFSGEVIDVDAYTGGFNLQIAFATGILAGNNL